MELVKKLSRIQRELVCEKNLYNSFGKYKYRNLESIFDALKKHLNDELVVKIDEDMIMLGDRIYNKCTASITDGKDTISAVAFAREAENKKGMDPAQVSISTSSYSAKSAMQKLFMLDDTSNTHDVDAQDNTNTTATQEINKLIKAKKVNTVDFLKYFKVSAVSELTYDQQQEAIKMLEKK
jgi:hypothetical protein